MTSLCFAKLPLASSFMCKRGKRYERLIVISALEKLSSASHKSEKNRIKNLSGIFE